MSDTTVLIVGGGVAGGTAAASLRDEGFTGRIVLVTSEARLPYERPPVSKALLSGDTTPDEVLLHEPGWWQEHDVEVLLARSVTELGVSTGTALLDGSAELSWDRLVLATGAAPRPTPIEGDDLPGAFTLRTVEDALALRAALADAEHVAVVGSSWIGLEVAAAARGMDVAVTVVSPDEQPLAAVLGTEVGSAFRALHEEHDVTFVTGDVAAVRGDERATGVDLADGGVIDADLVVLGTGVHPNVALAKRAGLAIDEDSGGISVDAALRTSDERVFAIGDIAAHDHPRLGRLRVEHVEVARGHGQTVARVLAGDDDAVHDDLPLFYTDQYDLGMEYVGHASPDRVVVRGDLPARPFVAFYLDEDDVLRAGMHADEWDATDVIRDLVGRRVDPDVLADTSVDLGDLVAKAAQD